MKIGIITFWQSSDNYGQQLQCWALQQYLKTLGHDPYLIRYLPSKRFSAYNLFWLVCKSLLIYPIIESLSKKLRNRKNNNSQYASVMKLKNESRKFDQFREKHIEVSDVLYRDLESLKRKPPFADCYITGSDQVWAGSLTRKESRAYFLDFGLKETRRVAYAASFGRDFYPHYTKRLLKQLLKGFDAVSVREDSGIKICEEVNVKAKKVLDPTFLLGQECYLRIAQTPPNQSSYFFTYSLSIASKEDIYWDEVISFAKKCGLHSITVTSSGYLSGREILDNTQYIYPTIPEWLGLILNSEFVVTTSFHGIVFCLILNKNFVYCPLKGDLAKGNSRILSLLGNLDLLGKVCGSREQVEAVVKQSINWEDVNDKLEKMRDVSVDFLQNSVG